MITEYLHHLPTYHAQANLARIIGVYYLAAVFRLRRSQPKAAALSVERKISVPVILFILSKFSPEQLLKRSVTSPLPNDEVSNS